MKLVQWLTKTIISISVMVIISTATSLLMVHAYVQQLFVRFGIDETLQPAALSDVLSGFVEAGTNAGDGIQGAAPANAGDGTQGEAGADGASGTGGPEEGGSPVHDLAPDNALPVMGSLIPEDDGLYISMEDLNERKESMTAEDKMDIFALLIKQLPVSEVQKISILLEDGLTAEEMEQASAVLQEHLTPEEYERLIGILLKYE